MSVGGVGGGGPMVPNSERLDPEAASLLDRLERAEGSGPGWLSSLDGSQDVAEAACEARADGVVGAEDVEHVVREAKDLGGITGAEHEALVEFLTESRDLFTSTAATALAAFLKVPLEPFRRPTPPAEPAAASAATADVARAPDDSEPPSFNPAAMPTIRVGASDAQAVRTLQQALNAWREATR
ncbi:hypothetical protein ACFL59_15015, partial [Planctomycetota bacterium]